MTFVNYLSLDMTGYHPQDRILVALDCIVFGFRDDQLHLLLIRRNFEPHLGKWSLMGGFLGREESLDQAAHRILLELTGLQEIYLEQFHAFGAVNRDSVERIVSVGYYALINLEKAKLELRRTYSANWVPIDEVPELIFDHNDMVAAALKRLRHRATHEPVGFELLPERFTLSQLQRLYEAVFGCPIDSGNFRRRLRKMDFLEQQPEKDFTDSRKGAWYYRFQPDRYQQSRKEGISFLLKP